MKRSRWLLMAVMVLAVSAPVWACNCNHGKGAKSKAVEAPKQTDALAPQLLTPYLAVRAALGSDTTEGVAANAEQFATTLKSGISRAEKDKKAAAYAAALKKLLDAAQPLADKKANLTRARAAFAAVSDAFVDYVRANVSASDAAKYQLFYCGMAKHYWLQKSGEDIGNPYFGAEMAECGEKEAIHATAAKEGGGCSGNCGGGHEHMHGM